MKFEGEKYVLREKENAEVYNNYSGLVLDPAEIVSPSHITQQLTINKNVPVEDSLVLEEEKRGKSVLHAPPPPHYPLPGGSKLRTK